MCESNGHTGEKGADFLTPPCGFLTPSSKSARMLAGALQDCEHEQGGPEASQVGRADVGQLRSYQDTRVLRTRRSTARHRFSRPRPTFSSCHPERRGLPKRGRSGAAGNCWRQWLKLARFSKGLTVCQLQMSVSCSHSRMVKCFSSDLNLGHLPPWLVILPLDRRFHLEPSLPDNLGKGKSPRLALLWGLIPDSTWVWRFHGVAPKVSLPWAHRVICSWTACSLRTGAVSCSLL